MSWRPLSEPLQRVAPNTHPPHNPQKFVQAVSLVVDVLAFPRRERRVACRNRSACSGGTVNVRVLISAPLSAEGAAAWTSTRCSLRAASEPQSPALRPGWRCNAARAVLSRPTYPIARSTSELWDPRFWLEYAVIHANRVLCYIGGISEDLASSRRYRPRKRVIRHRTKDGRAVPHRHLSAALTSRRSATKARPRVLGSPLPGSSPFSGLSEPGRALLCSRPKYVAPPMRRARGLGMIGPTNQEGQCPKSSPTFALSGSASSRC